MSRMGARELEQRRARTEAAAVVAACAATLPKRRARVAKSKAAG